jgi:nicotinate phosphoribosyltransferase
MAARASYLAGFAGTATMLAEEEFGIPTFGTLAHSFIEAYDSESAAFECFARSPRRISRCSSTPTTPRRRREK